MPDRESTCWTVVRDAADGDPDAKETFARRYTPVIRACLGARWRGSPLVGELEDAVQEVFLACFKDEGVLHRAEPGRVPSFRAYLFGVIRNVARRFEEKRARAERQPGSGLDLEEIEARDDPLSKVFDREWAMTLLRQATRVQRREAQKVGKEALRRVELLRYRFQEGMPIREIARLWEADPARLHHDYATAREEFGRALREVVREHLDGSAGSFEAECERLAAFLH